MADTPAFNEVNAMPPQSMVDRVARASGWWPVNDHADCAGCEKQRQSARKKAREILAVMRVPTDAMAAAAAMAVVPITGPLMDSAMAVADIATRHPYAPRWFSRDDIAYRIATIWTAMPAMIDAALREEA